MRHLPTISRLVRFCFLGVIAFGAFRLPEYSRAETPLHERIDALLDASLPGTPAPLASDAEFLRRVYLDLTGTIPTAQQAREFLDDRSLEKRERLIDELLASPEFVRHMTTTFDVMWMERRPDKHVKTDEWRQYLFDAFATNKPLNKLAAEILGADGVDDALRPAAKFYLDRDGETNLLTRDVGRMFFGMDLQCAQCHDHPLIVDYYQSDYYGIFAFLNRSFVYADAKAKKSYFAEKAEGGVEFKSVFTGESGETGPRLPGGEPIEEPTFPKGEEYVVKPAKDVRPVPKFSRRAQLAARATNGENEAFNRNLANRLWYILIGRGLVDPVDLHHSDNPPAHPELLQLLSDELVAMNFDLRRFLGQLTRTRVYQRSLDMPPNLAEQGRAAAALLSELKDDEQVLREKTQQSVVSVETAMMAEAQAGELIADANIRLEASRAARDAAKSAVEQANIQLNETRRLLAAKQDLAKTMIEAASKTLAAAERLAAEANLSAAIAVFQARAEELKRDETVLNKTADDQTAAVDAMAGELANAEEATIAAAEAVDGTQQRLAAAREAVGVARAKQRAARRDMDEFRGRLERAESLARLADESHDIAVEDAIIEQWTNDFYVAGLKPLSPEQIAAAILQATGVTDNQRVAVEAALVKSSPLADADRADVEKMAKRDGQREQALYDKLKGNIGQFVNLFGAGPGQPQAEFFATVDQALFFANGSQIQSWLAPSGDNLTARLGKLDDHAALAEELYLAVLTRRPSEEEIADVRGYLENQPEQRAVAIQELAWALLTSAEFRFGH